MYYLTRRLHVAWAWQAYPSQFALFQLLAVMVYAKPVHLENGFFHIV